MRRKPAMILTVLTAVVLLAACGVKTSNQQNSSTSMPANQTNGSCQINSKFTNFGGWKASGIKDKNLVFRSRAELDIFLIAVKQYYKNPEAVLSQLKTYTDEWFQTHILYYNAILNSTISAKYLVKNVEKCISPDGRKAVTIYVDRTSPATALMVVEYSCLFVEFNRSEIEDVPDQNFSIVIIKKQK